MSNEVTDDWFLYIVILKLQGQIFFIMLSVFLYSDFGTSLRTHSHCDPKNVFFIF